MYYHYVSTRASVWTMERYFCELFFNHGNIELYSMITHTLYCMPLSPTTVSTTIKCHYVTAIKRYKQLKCTSHCVAKRKTNIDGESVPEKERADNKEKSYSVG